MQPWNGLKWSTRGEGAGNFFYGILAKIHRFDPFFIILSGQRDDPPGGGDEVGNCFENWLNRFCFFLLLNEPQFST